MSILHRKTNVLLAAALTILAGGCANMNMLNRSTALPGNGIAVHLDAPQRVMYVDSDGRACAEPTPDALQAYVSSLGGSAGIGEKSASISQALSANAHSVGLHTQSITLMREHLFRMCAYAQNRWLHDGGVMLLMERSQDLTLGVLAIEQLTGAVVARPAVLRGAGGADAAASINDTRSQLDRAQKDVLAKQAALDAADQAQAKQAAELTQTQTALDAAKQADAAGKAEKSEAEVTALTDQATRQQTEHDRLLAAAAAAQQALDQANKAVKVIQTSLDGAMSTAQASVKDGAGGATPVTGNERSNLDSQSVKYIAEATKHIVDAVLNKRHVSDMCINMMTRFSEKSAKKEKQDGELKYYEDLMAQCKGVIALEIQSYRDSANASADPR